MNRADQMTVAVMPSALHRWSSVVQLWHGGEVVVELTVPRNQRRALQALAHTFHMEVLESHEDNELARQAITAQLDALGV